ncbi:MAG: hypothetical protein IKP40_13980 [Clostridia bacterium]|nr:hypothetical protein [Clostridia bacterium]
MSLMDELERLGDLLPAMPNGPIYHASKQRSTCPVCGKKFIAGHDWDYGVGAKNVCSWTCQRKMERGEYTDMGRRTISESDISWIQSLRRDGKSLTEIMAETGFAKGTVEKYCSGIQPEITKEVKGAPAVTEKPAKHAESGQADSSKVAKLAMQTAAMLMECMEQGAATCDLLDALKLQLKILQEAIG